MNIASPWDHRAYEREGEKIEKYQDLKREIKRLWGIRHLKVVPRRGVLPYIGYIGMSGPKR